MMHITGRCNCCGMLLHEARAWVEDGRLLHETEGAPCQMAEAGLDYLRMGAASVPPKRARRPWPSKRLRQRQSRAQ